jgi:hypothetical protein
MKIIFGGIAWFLIVFIFHLILWRIRVPKKPFKVLFFVVLFFSLFGAFIWWLFPLSFFPKTGIAFIHTELLFLCLGFSYILFYQGIKSKSPSMNILMTVNKSGDKGVEKNILNNIIGDDNLMKPRIRFLVQTNLAYMSKGKYYLTSKGKYYSWSIIWYRRLLRLSEYGG